MTTRPLVILHGYSDTSASFRPLATALAAATGREPRLISLGDYVTLNDYVSFIDLLVALDRAWTDHDLPRQEGAVDMVVHSTGALVARQWLTRLATSPPGAIPVKRLVMLAPANFGSPLAHKGQSFIGRIIKGSQPNSDGPLQSGRLILKGLELASPFTWSLAEQDRFVPESQQLYKPGRCLCTVLVGARGYGGIMAMANEDGGDGTVRISTANMNCARATLDLTAGDGALGPVERSTGRTAFGLLERFNHSTIALKDDPSEPLRQEVVTLITSALAVTDETFDDWCQTLAAVTGEATRPANSFQHTIVSVRDDQIPPRPVRDYNIAFREVGRGESGGAVARYLHEIAVEHVHTFSDDPSLRALYVNAPKLLARIDRQDEALGIAVAAYPRLADTSGRVGFKPIDPGGMDCGRTEVPADRVAELFEPHRTMMLSIILGWHRGELVRFTRVEP